MRVDFMKILTDAARRIAHSTAAAIAVISAATGLVGEANATPFTMTTPNGIALPTAYPQAGGVAMVMVGVNGSIYYQFSDPAGAFVGFQDTGSPPAFRGNPFTINSPITLNCGATSCTQYFGGGIAAMYVRFSAQDGDTEPGNFDFNDIGLVMNGFTVGNWSSIQTQITNTSGSTSSGFQTGFGNNTFNTGWFTTTDPALLGNILSTGSTTTQVFDRDRNDNYWDFTVGGSLTNPALRTIAPGYTLTKTSNRTTFTQVGDVIIYSYVVTNVGSVNILNLAVSDNKLSGITCNKTTILQSATGGPTDFATCTGTYTVSQADVDAGAVTNVAFATGTPEFGVLGQLTATATVTGPAAAPALSMTKTAGIGNFGAAGTTVPYTFTYRNNGNVTLTNITVTDPKIPGLSCAVSSLAPGVQRTCTGNYTVTQADVDAWAQSGTQLTNTATVRGTAPSGTTLQASAGRSLNGPVPAPAYTMTKTVTPATYSAVGTVLNFSIQMTNTGNVSFPAAPAITDPLVTNAGGAVTCPVGVIAPGSSVTCTASYAVTQTDLDARALTNTANATITVGGVTAARTASVVANAAVTAALTIDKQLDPASPTSFDTVGTILSYRYLLTNTGNVTLSAAQVADNRTTVTCPVGTIAPGATLTCTSTYTITQADINAGGVTNTASGSALPAGSATRINTAAPDSVTVPAVQRPGASLVKTAPTVSSAQFAPGFVVTYTYQITNSGNTTLTQAINVTDSKIGTFACGAVPLAPGATTTCNRNYTITPADVAAGLVFNSATATSGTTTSNTATAAIPQSSAPGLSLSKSANPTSFSALSDTITYTFTITNSGQTNIVSLTPITLSDPKVAGTNNCATQQPANLAPGGSYSCTGTYTPITQSEMDAGVVTNIASASFNFNSPAGPVVVTSPTASVDVTANVTPSMTLAKTGPASFNAVGQVITFNFTITNTGLQTITTATVTDPKIPALSCTRTNIAPNGGTATCSGTYTVTQADMDAGTIGNTATVSGTTPSGSSATATGVATVPVAPGAATKSMTLDKTSTATAFTTVGQTIPFRFAVRNTGTQTLTGITVTDSLIPTFSCTISALAPGATNSGCTANYVITQADIDAGTLTNGASAAATGATTATDAVTIPGPAQAPGLTLAKAASPATFATVGQAITYTMTVRNTGNVTLTSVSITDPKLPALSCTIATLAPGASNASCIGTYSITQADIDAGTLTNTAGASGTRPGGGTVGATGTRTIAGPAENPGLTVSKTEADGSGGFGAVGTSETYNFAVTNTGNVTLINVAINDPLTGFACTIANLAPGATATSCANSTPLQASITVTQAQFDAGQISNTVGVSAQTTKGTSVTGTDTLILSGPTRNPAITMVKSATSGQNFTAPGQTVNYSYVVTNAGNMTLSAPVTVTDNKIATVSCPSLGTGLAPGLSVTCTGTYSVTQADIDAGFVTNNATATITQPLSGIPSPVVVTASNSATVNAAQAPAMSFAKSITSGTPSGYNTVGDVLSYSFLIRNTGNTTITGPVQIVDALLGAPFNCASGPIAPAGTASCTRTYTVTQADLDAGSVTNSATAGAPGVPAPPPSTATAFATQSPSLAVAKSTTQNQSSDFTLGNVITYTYQVTNTGNVTLPGPIPISDNRIPGVSCAGPLAPGATVSCAGTYTLTANDLSIGSVTNNASANVTFAGNPVPSTTASVTIPQGTAPALSIVKTETTGAPITSVGQTLTYQYVVTNSGNAQFISDVNVFDNRISGTILCHDSVGNTVPLNVGASATCTANYSVTQADLDADSVTNTAAAQAIFAPLSPTPTTIQSPATAVTVSGAPTPALTVAKTVTAGPNPAAVGNVLTYQITTTNSGNQTLSVITVSDPLVPALSCTIAGNPAPPNIILMPTDVLICTGSYTVTQTDVDSQTLTNTATVTGLSPQGAAVSQTASHTHPLVAPASALTVVKTILSPTGLPTYSQVNDLVTYGISVTNAGNITLSNVTVSDDRVPGTCAIGTLAPGATDTSCQFVQSITQADIDAGSVVNTATATGQPQNPGAPQITGQGQVTAQGPAAAPSFLLAKTSATTAINVAGQIVTYDYAVTNVGNVTITAMPQVTDDKIGTFACGAAPIPPGTTVFCQASYTVTQADLNAGSLTNIATVTATGVPPSPQTSVTLPVASSPGLRLTKAIQSNTELFPFVWRTTFVIDATNSGNITLTSLDIQDDLAAFVAPATLLAAQYPVTAQVTGFATATVNPAYDGVGNISLLATGAQMNPGERGQITITATYSTQSAFPNGINTVTATSPQLSAAVNANVTSTLSDSDGDGIPDTLEFCGPGSDRDGDGICDAQDYDPTGYFYCEDNGEIIPGGSISVSGPAGSQSGVGSSNGITIIQDGSTGAYTFFVSAPGRYTLTPSYPSTGLPSTTRIPTSGPLDITGFTTNPGVLGSGENGSTGFLSDYTIGANTPSFLVFDIDAGDPHVIGNNFAMTGCAGSAPITASKTANVGSARKGESVLFTLTFTNPSSAAANGVTLVDVLPAGLIYTPGTATVGGVASEPVIAGNRLSWGPYNIVPGATQTVTLSVRVAGSAAFGTLVNKGWVADGSGAVTSNVATASVRVEPEHVFDCSDVIGKVFDDENMNGYQDEGEEGIPRARVVTVRGVRITADDNGRFHVPCAELPSDIGTNFTLKLDTRSLPSGYRVTTENPRTLRLTAGKMAKINFGAAIANVVDLDLASAAFKNGSSAPKYALEQAVGQLVAKLKEKPSVVRLSYLADGEPRELIRARLDAVEEVLRNAWVEQGRYKLNIERTVKRVQ